MCWFFFFFSFLPPPPTISLVEIRFLASHFSNPTITICGKAALPTAEGKTVTSVAILTRKPLLTKESVSHSGSTEQPHAVLQGWCCLQAVLCCTAQALWAPDSTSSPT